MIFKISTVKVTLKGKTFSLIYSVSSRQGAHSSYYLWIPGSSFLFISSTSSSTIPSSLQIPCTPPPFHHNPRNRPPHTMAKKGRKPRKVSKEATTTEAITSSPKPAHNKRKLEDPPSGTPSKKIKGNNANETSSSSQSMNADSTYLPSIRAPQHSMNDIVGLDAIKKEILSAIIHPFGMDEMSAKILKIKQPTGLLLLGPPGCGKSALADAIVNLIREKGKEVKYYTETGGCLSQWVGESERNLRTLFATAQENGPAVIFLDEIDGVGSTRENTTSGGGVTRLTTLLTQINNIQRGQVLLIGATNREDLVDSALVRPGRFDVTLKVNFPTGQERFQILDHYMKKTGMQIQRKDMERLVKETANWSGAALEGFVDRLHLARLERADSKYYLLSLTEKKKLVQRPLVVDMDRDVTPLLKMMQDKQK